MQPRAVSVDVVRPLRRAILRPGQSDDAIAFAGDDDPQTLHSAVSIENEVVAVATVMRDPHPHDPRPGDWRIRGMATLDELRNRGIGAALLDACESHAREHEARRLWCTARVKARAFYERAGWTVEGEALQLPTIGPHYLMQKALR